MTTATAIPSTFWNDDLEMHLDHVMQKVNEDGFLDDWIAKRTGRQLTMLCDALGLDGDGSTRKKRAEIENANGQIEPFVLVERFSQFKSKVAVAEFAQGVLDEDACEECQKGEEDFDKVALLFAIFARQWTDLRLIYHLDKIHKTGFARMKLKGNARKPKKTIAEFLTTATVKKILAAFDKDQGDGLTSELKDVITINGGNLVFIRRANRPDHLVKRTGGVIHGYTSEWIILDFEDGGKRVNISSVSVNVPLEIANRIASGYFGKDCEYDNESEETYPKQLQRFLGNVKDGKDKDLTLVEFVVSTSPLDGAPKFKLSHQDSNPIGAAIDHFEKAVGKVLADIDQIESVKVLYRKKRVSLIFEPVDDTDDEYVVRYSDHRLNARQRREFESHMKENHGIAVLSTEKRFKRSS